VNRAAVWISPFPRRREKRLLTGKQKVLGKNRAILLSFFRQPAAMSPRCHVWMGKPASFRPFGNAKIDRAARAMRPAVLVDSHLLFRANFTAGNFSM
jgi:hypothetical protein